MDNDNQLPPLGPTPMDGPMPSGQPMNSGLPQNEVSRILMSQGSMPGGAMPQGMGQGAMPPVNPEMMQNPGMNPNMNGMPNPGGMPNSNGMQNPGGMPNSGTTPQAVPLQATGPDGRPMMQQQLPPPPKKKDVGGLIKTIAIIALSLLAFTFIALFGWMKNQYDYERTRDLDSEVSKAVAIAKDDTIMRMEAEFSEREKYPYKTFAGPADYGSLTFEYPKTWSVYVAAAADDGGDFNAYFNPIQVDAVGKDTINALRVTIRNRSFEDVVAEYQKAMEKKDSNLSMESVTVFQAAANRYTGTIPGTELEGIIVVFKIRDKTVIMQTDSMFFKDEFDKLLQTVTFNA